MLAEMQNILIGWINERHAIYLRKALRDRELIPLWANPMRMVSMHEWPGRLEGHLTADPVLQQYRFCNAFRELDRVTVWIREHIREPYADHEHLWFMLAIARFVNWPPTLQRLIESPDGWPSDPRFCPERMTAVLEDWKADGNKVETGAYMIRAESDPKKEWYNWSKQRYIAEIVLGLPWCDRQVVKESFDCLPTLEEAWVFFRQCGVDLGWVGWGPFMVGQVVADLRHTRYLRDAPDVGRWAPVGPGSSRGLNRLHGRDVGKTLSQAQGLDEMLAVQEFVNARTADWVPEIELHDIQNALCEFDKYLRVLKNQGKPRARYVPGRGY